jgi:predicted DNA-binding protein with PD1-like motif
MTDKYDTSYAFRLLPGNDLLFSINKFVKEHQIKAGWIVTCCGSLTNYSIRFANQKTATKGLGFFEIISLSGTVSENGCHLHICISDHTGKTIGGHLLDGNIIYTTAEIVLTASGKFFFTREKDGSTQWNELQIKENL